VYVVGIKRKIFPPSLQNISPNHGGQLGKEGRIKKKF
jgi:hypothetical protein